MKIFVFFKEALRAIWAHKLRSALTLLGVFIGVFAVSVMVSLGEGTKENLVHQINQLGSNLLFVIPAKLKGGFLSNPARLMSGEILTQKDVEEIKKVEEVEDVIPSAFISAPLRYEQKLASTGIIIGTPSEAFSLPFFELERGRPPKEKYEAVLGREVLSDLGIKPEEAIGKKLKLKDKEVTICGVFKEKPGEGLLGQNEMAFVVVVPWSLVKEVERKEKINRILVKAKEGAEVKKVKEEIQKVVNRLHEEEVSVIDQEDLVDFLSSFLLIMTALVSAIAAISLVVGGI
ncbi:ABC transporter permease, partial [bacterium]|nr:ABC transporter permease [bacterium]